MLDALQLHVAAENRIHDVVQDVRILDPSGHDNLLPLGPLGLHVVLPEVPLLLAGGSGPRPDPAGAAAGPAADLAAALLAVIAELVVGVLVYGAPAAEADAGDAFRRLGGPLLSLVVADVRKLVRTQPAQRLVHLVRHG